MSFVRINPGDLIQAVNVNQIIDALTGAVGKGVAMAMTALNDQTNYALTVQNQDATNSRALLVLNSAGTMMERIDATGISFGTPLNLANNSVQGAALVDAGVPNAKLGPDVARANLLTNGGFEIWQRGNGPFTTSSVFTADRWQIGLDGTDTLNVQRDAVNIDVSSGNAAVVAYVHGSGTGGTGLYQPLQPNTDLWGLRGRPLTFSVRVRASTANVARAFVNNNGTLAYSSYHTGDGTYQTLSVTVTAAALPTTFNVGVSFNNTNATVYIDNANLVVGSQPANYVPLHPADDLARCLRYYEILGESGSSIILAQANSIGGSPMRHTVYYKARKAVAPTVTKNGTWTVSNCGQPGVGSAGVDSVWMAGVVTAPGDAYMNSGNSGVNISVEANP